MTDNFSDVDHHHSSMVIRRPQGFSATFVHFFEAPTESPDHLEIWSYTDKMSYFPGETVEFKTSTTAEKYGVTVVRDGLNPETVYSAEALDGAIQPTPDDAYMNGCKWETTHRWTLPDDLPSGMYLVVSTARNSAGEEREQHDFFVVRCNKKTNRKKMLLILGTSTWTAYNDWGGANSYEGIYGTEGRDFSPYLSLDRPFSRGQLWLPEGAPRIPIETPLERGAIPRYANVEFAFAQGYAKYYAAAGWASYERHFVRWAEQNGYEFDYATQHDLHFDRELLKPYNCAILVGHDEYWSRDMRLAVDGYVEGGGKVARFGANFCWQVRLEEEGKRQTCFKYIAGDDDPVKGTENEHLLSSAWEDPAVGWPGTETFGLNGFEGVYVKMGNCTPRSSGGYTVYRPDHWAYKDTDLYYGDVFGSEANIFGFEVDGLEYTFEGGCPVPTFTDGAQETTEILAMSLATTVEANHGNHGALHYIGEADAGYKAILRHGEATPETIAKIANGCGMMITFTKGKGEVFNAGTCEWVMGLKKKDGFTEQITKNVLDRFSK